MAAMAKVVNRLLMEGSLVSGPEAQSSATGNRLTWDHPLCPGSPQVSSHKSWTRGGVKIRCLVGEDLVEEASSVPGPNTRPLGASRKCPRIQGSIRGRGFRIEIWNRADGVASSYRITELPNYRTGHPYLGDVEWIRGCPTTGLPDCRITGLPDGAPLRGRRGLGPQLPATESKRKNLFYIIIINIR